jgi:CubicO group peptidase (beta-lactamase class C family)
MVTSFQGLCEAAAADWEVPSLVAGMSLGSSVEVAAVGCDPGTRFRVASVTKPLTAFLVLSQLGPDEAVRVWPADVRVRHLLSHTSGFDSELGGDYARFGDGDDALARCVADLPGLRRFLGVEEVWSYANAGYWLAGLLAAECFGGTYEEALHAQVLGPAGLESTSFAEPGLEGHGSDLPPTPYPRARRPSGGLTSTVDDLLRAGSWLLRQPGFEQMRVVHGKPVRGVYGLGLFGERVGGIDVWGHPGSYGGFQSSLLTVPDRDAVFVGLTNSDVGAKALRALEDAFFERAIGERRRQPRFVKLEASTYAGYEGTYENSDATYVVEHAGDGLVLHVNDEELVGLAIDERTFQVAVGPHIGERFDFPRDGFGRFGSRVATRVA